MKKFLSSIVMLLVAAVSSAQTTLIDYPTSQAGITCNAATGATCEFSSVKVKTNSTSVNGIKIGNGYVKDDALYAWVTLSVEGGFKAGDVINIGGYFNNSDDNKSAAVTLWAGEVVPQDADLLFTSSKFVNGRLSNDEPVADSYTLTADANVICIGRASQPSATAVYITTLNVVRPAPAINITDVTAEVGQTEPNTWGDVNYTATLKFTVPENVKYAYCEGIHINKPGEVSNSMLTIPNVSGMAPIESTEAAVLFVDQMVAYTTDPTFQNELREPGTYEATATIVLLDEEQNELGTATFTGNLVFESLAPEAVTFEIAVDGTTVTITPSDNEVKYFPVIANDYIRQVLSASPWSADASAEDTGVYDALIANYGPTELVQGVHTFDAFDDFLDYLGVPKTTGTYTVLVATCVPDPDDNLAILRNGTVQSYDFNYTAPALDPFDATVEASGSSFVVTPNDPTQEYIAVLLDQDTYDYYYSVLGDDGLVAAAMAEDSYTGTHTFPFADMEGFAGAGTYKLIVVGAEYFDWEYNLTSSAISQSVNLDDNGNLLVNGINEINKNNEKAVLYNLAGQRISKAQGIVIKNGSKMIVK